MAITRLQLEKLLVGPDMMSGRAGRIAVKARLYDPTTVTLGAIPALADPIYQGLRSFEVYAADPTDPVDADIATIAPADLGQMLDVAELRLLESSLGNWDRYDQQAGIDSQSQGRLGELLLKRITDLRAKLVQIYGVVPGVTGTTAFGIGVIDLDFQQSTDPAQDWPLTDA